MSEIERYEEAAPVAQTDTWVAVLADIGDLATKIASTDFVPDAYRNKPAAVAACILYGRELGLPPMTALKSINVIKGKTSLESEAMRALILAAGHRLQIREATATRCIILGCRKGTEDWRPAQYTIDEAKTSGDYAKNGNYKTRPTEMLIARATSRLARMMFPDVIGGFPSPEDVLSVDETAPETAPERAVVSVETAPKRAKPAPKPAQKPPVEVESGAVSEPPLPGEEGFEALSDDAPPPPEPPAEADIVDGEVIEEEMITAAQTKKLFATLRDIDVTDKADALPMIGEILAREIESTKDMTKAEASLVIDTLTQMAGQPDE